MTAQLIQPNAQMIWAVIIHTIPCDEPPDTTVFPCASYEDAKDCLRIQYDEALEYVHSAPEPDSDGYPDQGGSLSNSQDHYYVWVQDSFDEHGEIQHLPIWQTENKIPEPFIKKRNRLKEILS